MRAKLPKAITAGLLVVLLTCPAASAAPASPLCEDGSYRAQHPLICDTGETGAPGSFPGGGGNPGSGGLLGTIGRVLHGLSGGLLP